MIRWFPLVSFFLSGCGGEDPVLKAAREEAQVTSTAGSGQSPGGPGGPGGHPIDGGMASQGASEGQPGTPGAPLTPGIPEEPAPGNPLAPSPGSPGSPEVGVPGDPEPGEPGSGEDVGPTTTVRGEVKMLDYRTGEIRLDVFDGDHRSHAGQRPSLIRSVRMDAPGRFEMELPLSVTKVWIEASNDENQDGRPGPRDPSGRYVRNPLQLNAEGHNGLILLLERNDPPPGGGGAEL